VLNNQRFMCTGIAKVLIEVGVVQVLLAKRFVFPS
jgi:hypothetical protein